MVERHFNTATACCLPLRSLHGRDPPSLGQYPGAPSVIFRDSRRLMWLEPNAHMCSDGSLTFVGRRYGRHLTVRGFAKLICLMILTHIVVKSHKSLL
jgi:hypothetical protein